MRAFRIAYDGTPFHGFQRQPAVSTVEDTLFDALGTLGVLDEEAQKPDGYAAAGRTDAGVSALAQTVAFEAPDWLTPRALNSELPASIRAWAWADVPADFHATHDADERTYRYFQSAEPAVDDSTLCEERLDEALCALAGTHDYHNLTPDEHNTERTVAIEWTREDPFVRLTFTAGGFSRQLVRRLVSAAVSVARGDRPPAHVDRLLSPESLPGHLGVPPAPPEPLVLAAVSYPGVSFRREAAATASARRCFDRRRVDLHARARVARSITSGLGGLDESREGLRGESE